MNRPIKFRAWFPAGTDTGDGEIEKGQMCYDLAFEDYEPLNDLLNGVEHLMQFTGLFDKNKKPIYEGDIIKLIRDSDMDDKGELIEVYFNDGAFLVNCDFGEGDMAPIGWAINEWEASGDKWEIVGNIYEHAHLIRG